MKKTIALLLTVITLTLGAQDIKTMMQSEKWYVQGYTAKNVMTFTRKPVNDKQVATAEFKASGKIEHCDLAGETFFDANGHEKTLPAKFHCDTVDGYDVKNGMIHIFWNDVKHWYFTISFNNGDFTLNPIKAEEFNK